MNRALTRQAIRLMIFPFLVLLVERRNEDIYRLVFILPETTGRFTGIISRRKARFAVWICVGVRAAPEEPVGDSASVRVARISTRKTRAFVLSFSVWGASCTGPLDRGRAAPFVPPTGFRSSLRVRCNGGVCKPPGKQSSSLQVALCWCCGGHLRERTSTQFDSCPDPSLPRPARAYISNWLVACVRLKK